MKKYNYEVYRLHGVDGMFLTVEDLVLPGGFNIAEECRVGIMIPFYDGEVEAMTMSVSDERWSEREKMTDENMSSIAFSYTGGEKGAEKMISQLLKEWEFETGAKVKFTTNLNEKLLKEIKKVAVEKDLNVNDIIEEQLKKYLEEE